MRVEFGEPHFTDEHTVRVGNDSYTARSWLIATVRRLQLLISRTCRDPLPHQPGTLLSRPSPASLAILGGGPIAIEMAQAFARLGTNVTVIQRSSQILTREDKDMAAVIQTALEADGVVVHLNAQVAEVKKTIAGCSVVIHKPDFLPPTSKRNPCLLPSGDTESRRAWPAGDRNQAERGGLMLDNRLRTSHPHIYGAGDVTGAYQFTHAAGYEGGVAVTNAILHLPRKVNYNLMPCGALYDPELASIGLNELRAREAGVEYSVWQEPFSANDRAMTEGTTSGMVKSCSTKAENRSASRSQAPMPANSLRHGSAW